jgi:hypothetical protein
MNSSAGAHLEAHCWTRLTEGLDFARRGIAETRPGKASHLHRGRLEPSAGRCLAGYTSTSTQAGWPRNPAGLALGP